jgi:predicted alpha/beta superfamily hydrolase
MLPCLETKLKHSGKGEGLFGESLAGIVASHCSTSPFQMIDGASMHEA